MYDEPSVVRRAGVMEILPSSEEIGTKQNIINVYSGCSYVYSPAPSLDLGQGCGATLLNHEGSGDRPRHTEDTDESGHYHRRNDGTVQRTWQTSHSITMCMRMIGTFVHVTIFVSPQRHQNRLGGSRT